MADLTNALLDFSALLRTEHAMDAAVEQAGEALRALEITGLRDRLRAKHALRSIFCSKSEDVDRFDKAFDTFFADVPHLTRRQREIAAEHRNASRTAAHVQPQAQDEPPDSEARYVLHARYSPTASAGESTPVISLDGIAEALADAERLLSALRLGRSRRWKPHVRGTRFDLRGTLRASLQTGGDPVRIRTLGHPLRNPRVVMLLDGSRSMSQHTDTLLQFAYALTQRSRRTRVFFFSTALRDVTADLRAIRRNAERVLPALGGAWGGGTRIGESLHYFLRAHGSLLDDNTLVLVASDGLDAGDASLVERSMRQIYRRSAGIVWLNPHAATPGYSPDAAGMRAALPYLSALAAPEQRPKIRDAARYLRR